MASSDLDPLRWDRPSGRPTWLHRVWRASLERPALVCLPALLVSLGALLVAHLLPARYRAAALVRVEWDEAAQAVLAQSPADARSRGLQVVRERVLGREALETVLREANPYRARSGGPLPMAEQLDALLDAVRVKPNGAGQFLIESVHADPALAADVSNRLATWLTRESERDRLKRAQADPALVEARLAEARRALEKALEGLRGRQEGGVPVATGEMDSAHALRTRLEAERRTAAASLAAARERAGQLRRAIEAQPQAVADLGASAELARLVEQRVELLRRYTEHHPDVEALDRRIRRLEGQVSSSTPPAPGPEAEAVRSEFGRVEAEIVALRRRVEGLDAELARAASPADPPPAPDPVQGLESLAEEVDRAQKAYAAIEDELHAAEVAWRLSPRALPRLRLVSEARAPERPYFPSRLVFGLVGLALGLAGGLGAALVAERRDPTVKDSEDLQELLPHPLLAEIPDVRVRRLFRRG